MQLTLKRRPSNIDSTIGELPISGRVRANRLRSTLFRMKALSNAQKQCGSCKEWKDRTAFGKQTKTYDGRQTWCVECARRNNRLSARQHLAEQRAAVIEKLGNQCRRCKFSDIRALQIDHVYGGGQIDNETHRGSRFYKKVLADDSGAYQILCANCNWIKRHERSELPKRIE